MFKRFKVKKEKSIVLNNESDLKEELKKLGLAVAEDADGNLTVTQNEAAPAEPAGDPAPDPAPASPVNDPFVAELKGLISEMGGVQNFRTMLGEVDQFLEAARHNAEVEKNKKDKLISALVANKKITLAKPTLEKLSIGELQDLAEAFTVRSNAADSFEDTDADVDDFSALDDASVALNASDEDDDSEAGTNNNGMKIRKKAGIGMAGSLDAKPAKKGKEQ